MLTSLRMSFGLFLFCSEFIVRGKTKNMAVNVRSYDELKKERFKDEGYESLTTQDQVRVEESIADLFEFFSKRAEIDLDAPELLWHHHTTFLTQSLSNLPKSYQCLDASRPWLCYWILHALELLDYSLGPEDISKIATFLSLCQAPDGGFGGGPGQMAHLATTYAAVCALCTLGTVEAYSVINRKTLENFLWSVKLPSGAFRMHVGGELDIRGVYCAITVARLTNIYSDKLFENSAQWISSCQTYEGGFSSIPGTEAHGGYAFCGIAALSLLGKGHLCDTKALLRWAVNRQMRFEGGFQGRTNKLVDGCYSYWQGGMFPIIQRILGSADSELLTMDRWLFHQEALQEYILVCCQHSSGGLVDKPGKPRDIYHTCYTLSGLTVAQHPNRSVCIVGGEENELEVSHPVYNISMRCFINAARHFYSLPFESTKG